MTDRTLENVENNIERLEKKIEEYENNADKIIDERLERLKNKLDELPERQAEDGNASVKKKFEDVLIPQMEDEPMSWIENQKDKLNKRLEKLEKVKEELESD